MEQNIYARMLKQNGHGRGILITPLETGDFIEKKEYFEGGPVFEELRQYPTGTHEVKGQRVFLEQIGTAPRLIVCGGGHVSCALIPLMKTLMWEVIVLEDRQEYANAAKKAGADRIFCGEFGKLLRNQDARAEDYYVCLTREHQFDIDCLRAIAEKEHAYAGVMSSRGRAALTRNTLLKEGYDESFVWGISSPIGTDIHAETPEEIAISIAGELISVKNRVGAREMNREILKTLAGMESENPERDASGQNTVGKSAILCTIIKKRGSAPRMCGTKMLVMEDRILGTIGGGQPEAQVIDKSRELLKQADCGQTEFMEFDLSLENSGEELLCGGKITVMLEPVSGGREGKL